MASSPSLPKTEPRPQEGPRWALGLFSVGYVCAELAAGERLWTPEETRLFQTLSPVPQGLTARAETAAGRAGK